MRTLAREHARFCYLALHRGQWAGSQVVPREYYDAAWRGSKVHPEYGALWWVYPYHRDGPKDLVQTLGFRGNNGYIVPSLDLVCVRLGDSDELPGETETFDAGLLKRVLAAIVEK